MRLCLSLMISQSASLIMSDFARFASSLFTSFCSDDAFEFARAADPAAAESLGVKSDSEP